MNTGKIHFNVSVIVPTYNRPDMLERALKSILDQTYQDFEIIVVNDAGENMEHVIRTMGNKERIRYVRHDSNKGLAAARNTGLKASCSKYIAYLDDDDIYYENHLETLVGFLEKSDFKVAYADTRRAVQEMKDGKYEVIPESCTKPDLSWHEQCNLPIC